MLEWRQVVAPAGMPVLAGLGAATEPRAAAWAGLVAGNIGHETSSSRRSHMQLIDVSHTIESGMLTYKGMPAPVICDYLSREASRKLYAAGTEFQIGRIDMVANTGTYLDSPFHRYADGKDLSQLPLQSLANLSCIVAHIELSASR